MAGYQEKKYGKEGKYGHAQLHKMVEVHFMQMATKLKLYGLTHEFKKELEMLTRIYKPLIECECLKKGE
jgi:hypothetical protein